MTIKEIKLSPKKVELFKSVKYEPVTGTTHIVQRVDPTQYGDIYMAHLTTGECIEFENGCLWIKTASDTLYCLTPRQPDEVTHVICNEDCFLNSARRVILSITEVD
jgi:hypothetical protein